MNDEQVSATIVGRGPHVLWWPSDFGEVIITKPTGERRAFTSPDEAMRWLQGEDDHSPS